MQGNRKLKVFYVTTAATSGLIVAALVCGVQFTGDNITALIALLTANGVAFVGGNVGEHFADAKKPQA